MVDARLPSRWLNDVRFEALSDRAFRTFAGALMWSNEQGADGVVPDMAMKFLHPLGVDARTRAELCRAGLWRESKTGIVIPDWGTKMGQSVAQDIVTKREQNAERQRRHRQRKTEPVTPAVTRDVTGDDLGKARTGEERLGQDLGADERTGELVSSWPTRTPGSGVQDEEPW